MSTWHSEGVKRSIVALACVVLAVSGLSACSAGKQTTNSLDQQNASATPSPIPTVSYKGIATISYCVGQGPNFEIAQPITISVYRNVEVLGLKNTVVGKRVSIPIAAGSYDIVVNNTILHSGVLKDGETYTGSSGRLCQS